MKKEESHFSCKNVSLNEKATSMRLSSPGHSIHAISCSEESLESSDSELQVLPCSCWASWKLHSIAINVLGSSEGEKEGKSKQLK